MIQTDIAVNPGNSGGPMLKPNGLVFGLIDAKRTTAEGIAFAVSPVMAGTQIRRWQGRRATTAARPCALDTAPAPDSGLTPCSETVSAGPSTSCPFALEVERAWRSAGPGTAFIDVLSPVTGKTYRMQCSAGDPVICTGGDGAAVFINPA